VQLAHSAIAASAYQLVTALQRRMVEAQEGLAGGERFSETTWLRDDGRHGGEIAGASRIARRSIARR
jgi:coproporphyrinogen III oxidase